MKHFPACAFAALLALGVGPSLAQQFSAGDIVVEKPWARATPKGASVGAGYLTIRNKSAVADRLTGGTADFAGAVEPHQMSTKDGVMTMRLLSDGIEIPPNGVVTLTPGGYHLMFQGLKQPLAKGEKVKATLTFEHAGSVPVEFSVGAIGAMSPAGAKPTVDSMKGMKM
jgi:copper(I)-binding protein